MASAGTADSRGERRVIHRGVESRPWPPSDRWRTNPAHGREPHTAATGHGRPPRGCQAATRQCVKGASRDAPDQGGGHGTPQPRRDRRATDHRGATPPPARHRPERRASTDGRGRATPRAGTATGDTQRPGGGHASPSPTPKNTEATDRPGRRGGATTGPREDHAGSPTRRSTSGGEHGGGGGRFLHGSTRGRLSRYTSKR